MCYFGGPMSRARKRALPVAYRSGPSRPAPAITAAAVSVLVAALSSALAAQWPQYPASGVPRGADGKPDLTAPAPRTAEGVSDLSGIWNYAGLLGFRDRPPDPPPGTPPFATFWNIEAGIKEGLPFQPGAAELRKERMANDSKDNPDASCLPLGHMQLHTHSQPRKIVQTKDLIVIVYEANSGLRQIFLDGRPAPANDPQPWWYGYSRGWWDGDTSLRATLHATMLREATSVKVGLTRAAFFGLSGSAPPHPL